MGLFSIYEQKSDYDELNKMQQGSLFHSIEYELSGIVKMIDNIDSLDEYQIADIIVRQHQMILNYDLFLSGDTRANAQKLFTNIKFLKAFLGIIRVLNITEHEKICINKLAYDYYILPDKDKMVSDLLYQLTTEVNGREVIAISGIVGIHCAQILSMVRNSSFKEEKCVHRVNTYIVKVINYSSVQQIINIYSLLFTDRFGSLFTYTMLEKLPENATDQEKDAFVNISVALITMLDNMPKTAIEKVIVDYNYILSMTRETPRFNLKEIPTCRITEVLRKLEIVDNISI